eukprot:2807311-Prymnesium_polylepis.1
MGRAQAFLAHNEGIVRLWLRLGWRASVAAAGINLPVRPRSARLEAPSACREDDFSHSHGSYFRRSAR